MKKSNFWIGLLYIFGGGACLTAAILFNTRINNLLFSFSGAGIISGLVLIFKYFYWNSAKNKDRYAERLDNEHIELHDERKKRLLESSYSNT